MGRRYYWRAKDIAMLGKLPDTAIAEQLGIAAGTVRNKRVRLGISTSCHRNCHWGLTEIRMLGRYPDSEIAEITGRPLDEIVRKRKELASVSRKA